MAPLHVEVNERSTCGVVSVAGELDIHTAPVLEEALVRAEGLASGRIVVDLTTVDFIDSTGLSVILRSFKRVDRGSGEFSLVCPSDVIEVHRVLEILGFNEVFTIHETIEDAGCGELSQAAEQ